MPRPYILTTELLEVVVRLYMNKLNLNECADVLGCGYGTLWRYFYEHKIPLGHCGNRTMIQEIQVRNRLLAYMRRKGW